MQNARTFIFGNFIPHLKDRIRPHYLIFGVNNEKSAKQPNFTLQKKYNMCDWWHVEHIR